MPSTRRSTRGSSSRQITPVPKPKKTQAVKASPAIKKKSSAASRITSSQANRRSTSSKPEIPALQSKQSSPSPAPVHRQKRVYISDSDDDEIQVLSMPKQRRIQESDDEEVLETTPEEESPSTTQPTRATKNNNITPKSSSNQPEPQTVDSDDNEPMLHLVRTRRFSTRQSNKLKEEETNKLKQEQSAKPNQNRSTKLKQEQKPKIPQRLANKRIPKHLKEVIDSKFRRPTKIEKKEEKAEQKKCLKTRGKSDDEEVEAEFSVVLLRPQTDSCLSRVQFHQKPLQEMSECRGRVKRQVKHVELTYKTKRNQDGKAYNKVNAMYDGVYRAESSAKSDLMLRQAVGFFKSDRFYILPISETFEMTRKIARPADIDIIEHNRSEDSNLVSINALPTLNPVRVRFARTETEWQRKRREQSFQYRQMLYEQDHWVNTSIDKEDIRSVYKKEISKAKGTTSLKKNQTIPFI